jgi:hypothetical protein
LRGISRPGLVKSLYEKEIFSESQFYMLLRIKPISNPIRIPTGPRMFRAQLRTKFISNDAPRSFGIEASVNLPDSPSESSKGDESTGLDARSCLSTKQLLQMAEEAAVHPHGCDFALIDQVAIRCSEILHTLQPSEVVAFLQLFSRLDYVDSDFNDAFQAWLMQSVETFSDNHYPVLLASMLRMGIDQPVERQSLPDEGRQEANSISTPLMIKFLGETEQRVSRISEAGCLAILHSIVRRPKSKISQEMQSLVRTISVTTDFNKWGLALRIQAIHALSRLGIDNQEAIGSLLNSVTGESIARIPSANLQHLLSIIHNHANHHSEALWRPVLDMTVERIGQHVITRSMPLSTIAVTIGYLGRLGVSKPQVVNSLLMVFTGSNRPPRHPLETRITRRMISRILTDPQVDIAHLTGIVEGIDRLGLWDLHLAIPLALVTRRILLRDGIHNIKAAPLCQFSKVMLRRGFDVTDEQVRLVDSVIDAYIDDIASEGKVSTNWCLQSSPVSESPNDWRKRTILTLLEGLLKHEQYIRSTPTVIERCVEIREIIKSGDQAFELPSTVTCLLETVDAVEVS